MKRKNNNAKSTMSYSGRNASTTNNSGNGRSQSENIVVNSDNSDRDDQDGIDNEQDNELNNNQGDRTPSIMLDEKFNVKFEILCQVLERCGTLKTKEKLE